MQDVTLVEQVWHTHHNHPRAPPLSLLIKDQSLSMKIQGFFWNTLNPPKRHYSAFSFYPRLPRNTQKLNLKHKVRNKSALESHDGLCLALCTCVCICSAQPPCACLCVCAQICVCVYLLCPGLLQLSHLTTLKALSFLVEIVIRWMIIWKGRGPHELKKGV